MVANKWHKAVDTIIRSNGVLVLYARPMMIRLRINKVNMIARVGRLSDP